MNVSGRFIAVALLSGTIVYLVAESVQLNAAKLLGLEVALGFAVAALVEIVIAARARRPTVGTATGPARPANLRRIDGPHTSGNDS